VHLCSSCIGAVEFEGCGHGEEAEAPGMRFDVCFVDFVGAGEEEHGAGGTGVVLAAGGGDGDGYVGDACVDQGGDVGEMGDYVYAM